jgi:hypothetical protein
MSCEISFFSCANCSINSASFLIWRYDASILDSTRRTWKNNKFYNSYYQSFKWTS